MVAVSSSGAPTLPARARREPVVSAAPAPRVYALLGDPVAHSLSPRMQNAAFRHAGLDATYVARRAVAEDVPRLMRALARAGGGGNVTVPFKTVAAGALDVATPDVVATGACNTFWWAEGALHGDNTDVAGFLAAVRMLVPRLEGRRALVLGAGGAARAVVHALLSSGAAEVVVANRTPGRAEALVEALDDAGVLRVLALSEAARLDGLDLVVNATSLGLGADDPLPLDPRPGAHGAAFDLVYRPGGTAWTRAAAARGIPAAEGTEMLIRQGAEAFRRWTGLEAPLAVMRAALEEAAPAD